MIGVQVEGARQEGRERIGACEIRVSAVLSTGSSSVDRERRADAFTRSLLEASQTHTVRLRYETSIESRLDLSVSLADHPVPSDWSHLEAVLQGATGFAFERTGSCDRQEIGPVVAFAPPSIVGSASRPTTIGFGSRISAKCASVAQLPVLPWLLPNGIDEAVSLVVAVGEPAMIEVELQRRQLGPTEADTLQALYEACIRGTVALHQRGRWIAPAVALQEQLSTTLGAWLTGELGVSVYVGASGVLGGASAAALKRCMFVDTGVPSPPARSDVFAAQPQAVDLRCCFPLGASWSKLVPSDPSALKLIGPTRIAPAISTLPTSGSRLGTTTVGVRTADIRILPRDRERHIYCVGSTGVGKSTMLSGLILEDIRAGDGVCVIDPHGELSRQVLDRIPTARRRDVFWLKPGHEGRTFGLNLLQCDAGTSGVSAAVLANELLRVFGRLYDMRVAGGPVFEQYMRGAALLVMENRRPRGTVLDVVRVFESDSFRRGLLKTCINPVVVEFWTKTAHHASHELSLTAVAPYIVSKLNAFVSNLSVRTIIGQRRSTIDFGEAMANRAIVLLDLSVGSLGVADTQLLGMLVLSRLFAAALGRVAEGRSEAPPMRVYVDEAQVFATETLAEAMAQSRKGGLSFTLANQNLAQLKNATDGSRLLENIVSNASTFLAFRVGPFDSEILAPLFAPTLVRADLERLPDHHVACRLLVEGVPLEPFVCSTLALPLPDSPGDAREEIVARMPLYTRPMSEVEAEIALERTPTREE